jgi:hypothetical protein
MNVTIDLTTHFSGYLPHVLNIPRLILVFLIIGCCDVGTDPGPAKEVPRTTKRGRQVKPRRSKRIRGALSVLATIKGA